ncbi:hypothetical protein B4135_1129 [Caldibacillus debilis]|uniref:Uncharacterized protein n=1 Tax=Caldibacillus debilis TaxID=301148 RepID=A0A150MDV5_9BACI|nr:hypothetical protein B4135_1129 [Caldibacillus debilis]
MTDGTDEWAASEIPNLIKDLRNNPDSHKKAGTAFFGCLFLCGGRQMEGKS